MASYQQKWYLEEYCSRDFQQEGGARGAAWTRWAELINRGCASQKSMDCSHAIGVAIL